MNIFLTGAGGLLGGEMAARLLAAGHSVVGLVRRARSIYGNDGQILPVTDFDGTLLKAGSVALLTGDISLPGLGVAADIQATLATQIDLVLHCAAITDFNASEDIYRQTNVDGVRNALAFLPAARFLHVSTAYVCGVKNGAIAETPRDPDFSFANGYEQSKATGEDIVCLAGNRAVIARPSIVVGAHDTGTMRCFDTFYQAFRLIAEGQITTLPAGTDATLDFVPLDHVAGGLMDIISHWDSAAGKVFHLSSGAPISLANLADAIGRFPQLDRPKLVAPSDFSLASLAPLERRLYRHVAAFYSSYFQRCPRFETANLRALSGRVCPTVDGPALHRMITFCIEQGFIRAERQRISG